MDKNFIKSTVVRLTSPNNQKHLEWFFKELFEIGISRGRKSEVDTLLMHLLHEKTKVTNTCQLHDLSVKFGVPESYIRKFIYEGKLRYEDFSPQYIKAHLISYINVVNIDKISSDKSFNNTRFSILIEDQFFMQALEAAFIEVKTIPNYSFSSKILTINGYALSAIINHFYKTDINKERDIIFKQCKKLGIKTTKKGVVSNYLDSVFKATLTKSATNGVWHLAKNANLLFDIITK